MISFQKGRVKQISGKYNNCTEIIVSTPDGESKAVNYNSITGDVKEGDEVVINTTAVDLKLGSGGVHFVVSIGGRESKIVGAQEKGHIMKLRYTPLQFSVLCAEEQQSPYHRIFDSFESLNAMPVVIGELHSMLLPAVFNIKRRRPRLRVSYIMTDGGALPLDFSRSVSYMKQNGLIEGTITYGQAFGGDLETVNIYTALIAAREIQKSDIAVVTMGPGITGTGTRFGFSGAEQGPIIDAVNTLGGRPVFIPRISFAEKRSRHFGLSHHSITVLASISKTQARVVVPRMDEGKFEYVMSQIKQNKIEGQHTVAVVEEVKAVMENISFYDDNILGATPHFTERGDSEGEGIFPIKMTTMGRGIEEDPEFFLTAGAAGYYAADIFEA
ncbi:MAG: DUF3866 family protein [Tepidanaerobacteraceae bacterium]|nr:DUF3866 family protein [Tepidanaerobacteraceae bacterium]